MIRTFSHIHTSGTRLRSVLHLSVLLIVAMSCSDPKIFPLINTEVSSPIDIAVSDEDDSKQHFFVLNADFNHLYNTGSILLVKNDGSAVKAHEVSPLGRSLKVAGAKMLVTYDTNPRSGEDSKVELYSLEYSPENFPSITLEKTWWVGSCIPLNSALRKNHKNFSISCQDGSIYAGEFNENDLAASTLDKIRQFPKYVHRAIHIDTQRNRLYTFMTDTDIPNYRERYLKDVKSWNSKTNSFDNTTTNDIPDAYESNLKSRINLLERGESFQFSIIDLDDPENLNDDGTFKFKSFSETQDELHWMYFTTFDNKNNPETPEIAKGEDQSNYKYYRNNFWEVVADEDDSTESGFYLSQRGSDLSPHSNNVIHMKLQAEGDLKGLKTEEAFQFTRVYGTAGQKTEHDYLGHFSFSSVLDDKVLLINQFRSPNEFKTPYFSLKAFKASNDLVNSLVTYTDKTPFAKLESTHSQKDTFYQFSVSDSDSSNVYVLVSTFFQDAIKLYKLDGSGFTAVNIQAK